MTNKPAPADVPPGVGLRHMALSTPPSELGFAPDAEFPTVYGVVTDCVVGSVIATVMAMRDGTASLYTTSTFGIIGGEGHERVRQAAARCVRTGERFARSGAPVTQFAYPKAGMVFYYLLTYDGVRLVVGDEADIERGSDPTRPLFAAAQDVLTELRVLAEERAARPRS